MVQRWNSYTLVCDSEKRVVVGRISEMLIEVLSTFKTVIVPGTAVTMKATEILLLQIVVLSLDLNKTPSGGFLEYLESNLVRQELEKWKFAVGITIIVSL